MPPVTKKSFLKDPVPSSPYGLFAIPVSNSPPTPVIKKTRRGASRGRCQKKVPQAVIVPRDVRAPDEHPAAPGGSVTNLPPALECRVVLEKLDLSSLDEGVRLTRISENSDPNSSYNRRTVSKRGSIVGNPGENLVQASRVGSNSLRTDKLVELSELRGAEDRSRKPCHVPTPEYVFNEKLTIDFDRSSSKCRFDDFENADDCAKPGPSSSMSASRTSEICTPLRPTTTQTYAEELNSMASSTSSEESDGGSDNTAPGNSVSSANTGNVSIMKMRGRRKLSKPCTESSHHLSTSSFRSNASSTIDGASNMSSLLNSSKLSAIPKRRSLASIDTTTATEHTTPPLRRRRSETQFSEFYSSALRNAGRLQVVAEPMSWLKLAPLILPEYPIDFEYIFENWSMDIVSKLGEGSFSEVFRVRKKFDSVDHFDVFKVIPVGQQGQPTFEDMLPEMSMCLAGRCLLESPRNRAPSFLSLRGSHLVQGALTKEMVSAYETFREQKPEETEHPHPSERPPKQFYVAFYTSYDGVELEKELPNLSGDIRASIVLQVTYALAAAELSFEFEHRDLHLSNIVIKETEEEELEFRIGGEIFGISSFGKRAALIDYGMCRLVVDEVLHSAFEPEILLGQDLQRRTYRKQHDMLGGNYHERCLETNGLWITFLIKKLFPKRPVGSRLKYGDKVNRLFTELSKNHLSARRCVEILENRELNETQSFIL